ncbi:MAG: hypothetical protein Q9N32_06325 [Gammaproteobacteria bacterium]|nr:hypothetical protein [Gammaproteobacteria bacterium]
MSKKWTIPLALSLILLGVAIANANYLAAEFVVLTALIWAFLPQILTQTAAIELPEETKQESALDLTSAVHSMHDEAQQHVSEQLELIRSESQQVSDLVQNAISQLIG